MKKNTFTLVIQLFAFVIITLQKLSANDFASYCLSCAQGIMSNYEKCKENEKIEILYISSTKTLQKFICWKKLSQKKYESKNNITAKQAEDLTRQWLIKNVPNQDYSEKVSASSVMFIKMDEAAHERIWIVQFDFYCSEGAGYRGDKPAIVSIGITPDGTIVSEVVEKNVSE